MAISRFILAVITVLLLGPWTHGGAAMAAPIYPILAFNDFYHDSKPSGYFLGGSADGHWLQTRGRGRFDPGRRKISPLHLDRRGGGQRRQQAGQGRRRAVLRHVIRDPGALPGRARQPGGGGRSLERHAAAPSKSPAPNSRSIKRRPPRF